MIGVIVALLACVRPMRNFAFVYFVVFAVIFGGLRWSSGTDWQAYYGYFSDNTSLLDFISGDIKEPGHALYAYFVKSLGNNYTLYLVLLAAVISVINVRLLYVYTAGSAFVLCLYFLNTFGNIFFVRQTVAAAFVLLFLHRLNQKRLVGAALWLVCAVGFHYSAAVFVLAYYFVLHGKAKKIAFLSALGGGVLFAFYSPYIQEKIFFYFISGATDDFYDESFTNFLSARGIWLVILTGVGWMLYRAPRDKNDSFIVRVYIVLCGIFLLSFYLPLVSRFIQYFSFFEVAAFGMLVRNTRSSLVKVILGALVFCLYAYKLYAKLKFWPGETDVFYFASWL